MYEFARTFGLDLITTTTTTTTRYPTNENHYATTIDFGISKGLTNSTVTVKNELSSDHDPLLFQINLQNFIPPQNNYHKFTNWLKFQNIVKEIIPGNPIINSKEEIEIHVKNFTETIRAAIDQSSVGKLITHSPTLLPEPIRNIIRNKNRLRKRWQETRDPNIKKSLYKQTKHINRILTQLKNDKFQNNLKEAKTEDNSLYKMVNSIKKKTHTSLPPLLGHRGLDQRATKELSSTDAIKLYSSALHDGRRVTDIIGYIKAVTITRIIPTNDGASLAYHSKLDEKHLPFHRSVGPTGLGPLLAAASALFTVDQVRIYHPRERDEGVVETDGLNGEGSRAEQVETEGSKSLALEETFKKEKWRGKRMMSKGLTQSCNNKERRHQSKRRPPGRLNWRKRSAPSSLVENIEVKRRPRESFDKNLMSSYHVVTPLLGDLSNTSIAVLRAYP
ncbi:putative RNA-directed DNA polymerase from transposon X-element [Nephila pilipes]|uniref:Putative RNA-directed DNA polymerase from transposon X-element n=1 Tax=Nephila pilipes TaxID=299642 RepID=A0A8X6PQF0_NEPPI|nr:putative RNA-directed DNA polymerase from transposon X-element [Nephila pilipes]